MLKYYKLIQHLVEFYKLWTICPICLILAFTLHFNTVYAVDGEEICVEDIQPNLIEGNLTCSAKFKNLFSRKIIGMIQSGLASIIQIEVKLLESGKKSVYREKFVRTISYNLWEERYTIQSEDTTIIINEIDAAIQIGSRIEDKVLVNDSLLQTTFNYAIQVRVQIIPISMPQGDKISDLMENPTQTEEALASQERSSGFQFNVSSLVSFFAGRNKPQEYRSGWHTSKPFRIDDLR